MNAAAVALGPFLALLLIWPGESLCSKELADAEGFELNYQVFRNDKPQGKARLQLAPQPDGGWLLTMQVQADRGVASLIGFAETERSRLTRDADGQWRVQGYERERSVGWRTRTERADFDWAQRRVQIDVEGERTDLPAEPGLVDPNSVVLRLAADLAAGLPPGDYPVLRRGRIDRWHFRQVDEGTVNGRAVVVIERVRDHARRRTTSWLAPSLGYLPARIEQAENDDVLRLELRP